MRWLRSSERLRLEAYGEYAHAIKDVYKGASGLVTSRLVPSAEPLNRESGLQLLAEARAQRTRAWETVLLLGDAATVRAARNWREAVWQVEQIATNPELASPEWGPSSISAVDRARDSFYEAARGSLAVAGGSVAQASWLSSSAPWLPSDTREAGGSAKPGSDPQEARRPTDKL